MSQKQSSANHSQSTNSQGQQPKSVNSQNGFSNSISQKATALHQQLLLNNVHNTQNSSTQPKSNYNTLNLGNQAQQQRGWNFVQNSVNKNANTNLQVNKSQKLLGDNNNSIKKGSIDGLNFNYYPDEDVVEFTDGSVDSDLSQLNGFNSYSNIFSNAKIIQFDNNNSYINNLKNFVQTFQSDFNAKLIILPNDFDTSNVTTMSDAFYNDKSLQSMILPESFNTSKVNNIKSLFDSDRNLTSLTLPSSFNTKEIEGLTNTSHPLEGMFHIPSLKVITLSSSDNLAGLADNISANNNNNPRGQTDVNSGLDFPTWFEQAYRIHSDGSISDKPVNLLDGEDFNGKPYVGNGSYCSSSNLPVKINTVYYMYNNRIIECKKFVGISNTEFSAYSSIPNNYEIDNTKTNPVSGTIFSYDGSSHNVYIEPDQANATVNYSYNYSSMSDWKYTASGNSAATSTGNYSFTDTSSDNVPAGYHIVSDQNTNIPFDNNTHTINITPNIINETVNYVLNSGYSNVGPAGSLVATYSTSFGDARAKNDYNNSLNINNSNAPIPSEFGYPAYLSGYTVAGSSNISHTTNSSSSSFSNSIYVDPNPESETVYYSDSSENFYSSSTIAGGYYGENGSVASTPAGWSLSSGDNTSFIYGESDNLINLSVIPLKAKTYISFKDPKGVVASNVIYSGNSFEASGASNRSVKFVGDQSSVSGLPVGYHIASSVSIPYNNESSTVNVLPNSAIENIRYEYHNKDNSVYPEGSSTMNGVYDEKGSVDGTSLSYGYHLSGASNMFTYSNGTSSDNVSVTPNIINDSIKYRVISSSNVKFAKAGSVLSTETSRFNDNRAIDAGNISASIKSSGNTYVPTGYHMISSDATVGNKTTNSASTNASDIIDIAPDTENETVHYVYGDNSSSVSTSTISNGYCDNNGSVSTAPTGWSLSSAHNPFTFGLNNGSVNVKVVPSNANTTVSYKVSYSSADNNGYNIASYRSSGNSAATSTGNFSFNDTSADNVPAGYHIISGQNTNIPFDNNNHIIQIAPNTITDTINYQVASNASYAKSNQTLNHSEQITLNDNQASGAGNDISNIASSGNTYVSSGYHMLSSSATVGNHSSNATDVISIAPNPVTYDGTVTLNYHYGNSVKSIMSSYSVPTYVDNQVTLLDANDYLNKTISGFNTSNFSASTNNDYKTFTVPAASGTNASGNQISSNYTLNFNAQPVTEYIHYVHGKNSIVDSTSVQGSNDVSSNWTSTTSLSSDWVLSNTSSNPFSFSSNGVTNVSVLPKQRTDSLNYVVATPQGTTNYKGNNSGSTIGCYSGAATTGNDYRTSIGSTSFVIGNTPSGLPSGYSVASPNESFNYDGNAHSVIINPSSETETINYMYSKNPTSVSSATQSGYYDYQSNVSSFPNGWHLSNNASSSFIYGSSSNENSVNISIAPNTINEIVNYQIASGYDHSGSNVGTYNSNINDSRATQAGNDSLTINSGSASGLLSGYHVPSSVTITDTTSLNSSNNNTHIITVDPNSESEMVNYSYGTKSLSSSSISGGYYGESSSVTSAPSGWSLSGNTGFTFGSNDNSVNVELTPNKATDTIDYKYKGATKGTNQLTGNISTARGASDTTFSVTPQSDKGMPTGYQLVNNDNKFDFNGTTHDVAITPQHASDIVNYQYDNQTMNSHNFGGNTSTAQGASDTSFDVNANNDAGIPTGYHLVNKDNNFNYDGNQHNVAITPDQATDTIDYNNGNQTISSQTFTGDTSKAQGAKNSTVDITPTNDKELPQGYHLANNDNKFSYDGNTHVVSIVPNQATDTVNYQYNGTTKSSHQFSGNSSQATGASDTNFDVNSDNEPDLPAGYHLVNKDNQFNYDNNTHVVPIAPNHVSDTIQYQYNGQTIDTYKFGGNDYRATAAGDNSVDITPTNDKGLPNGWKLAGDSTNIPFDNSKHSVKLVPNQQTNTVNYQYNGKTISSHNFTGNNYRATQAGDNNFDVTKDNEPNIPKGYHLVNKDNTFNYDGSKNDDVVIAPDTATETVDYQTSNGTSEGSHQFSGNNANAQGASDTSFVIGYKPSGLAANYHVVDPNQTIDYENNNQTVTVAPDSENDTVNYSDVSHKHISSAQINGNYSSDAKPAMDRNIPNNWTVVSGDTGTYAPGHTFNVTIKPNQVTDSITFKTDDNSVNATKSYTGNGVNAQGATNTSFNVNGDVPLNYHATSSIQFNYDGQSHTVTIAPNSEIDTVNYSDTSHHHISSAQIKGNYNSSAKSAIDAQQPDSNNWTIVNGDNVRFVPNKTFNVTVSRNTTKDTVEYQYKGQTKGTQLFSGNSNSDLDITNSNAKLPNGYQLVDNNNRTTYDGKDFPVAITPKLVTENVAYVDQSGKQIGTSQPYTGNDVNAQGAIDTSFNANDHVPANYHAVDNTTFNYDSQAHTVTVAPNPETDDVNYIDSYGSHIKNTQIQGNYNSDAKGAIDAELPTHYHVVSGDTEVFTPDGTFNVHVSNEVTDKIVFTGDLNSHTTSTGAYGNKGTASIPNGYHITNGNGQFTYGSDNDIHTFNLAKNTIPTPKPTPQPNKPTSGSSVTPASGSAKPVKPRSGSQAGSAAKPTSDSTGSSAASGKSQSQSSSTVAPSSGAKPNSSSASSQSTSSTKSSATSKASSSASSMASSITSNAQNASSSSTINSASADSNKHIKSNAANTGSKTASIASEASGNGNDTNVPFIISANLSINSSVPAHRNALPNTNANQSATPTHRSSLPVNLNTNSDGVDGYMLKSNRHAKTPDELLTGQFKKFGKLTIARMPVHFRWFCVIKTCLAHKHLNTIGQVRDYYMVLRPSFMDRIQKFFRVEYHGHMIYRYEIKLNRHDVYVTGNPRFTPNAYLQKGDFRHARQFRFGKQRYYKAIVRKPCFMYRSAKYDDRNRMKIVHRGSVVKIKRIFYIGRKSDFMTRIQLTNGKYITANRMFIELIK